MPTLTIRTTAIKRTTDMLTGKARASPGRRATALQNDIALIIKDIAGRFGRCLAEQVGFEHLTLNQSVGV